MTPLVFGLFFFLMLSASAGAYLYGRKDQDAVFVDMENRCPPCWGTYTVFGEVQAGEQKSLQKFSAHWHDNHWTDRQGNTLGESERYNFVTHWLDVTGVNDPLLIKD